jgi:hypothetical protein
VLEEQEELNKSSMDRVMDDAQKVEKGARCGGLSSQKRRTWHKAFLLAYTAMDFLKVNGLLMEKPKSFIRDQLHGNQIHGPGFLSVPCLSLALLVFANAEVVHLESVAQVDEHSSGIVRVGEQNSVLVLQHQRKLRVSTSTIGQN